MIEWKKKSRFNHKSAQQWEAILLEYWCFWESKDLVWMVQWISWIGIRWSREKNDKIYSIELETEQRPEINEGRRGGACKKGHFASNFRRLCKKCNKPYYQNTFQGTKQWYRVITFLYDSKTFSPTTCAGNPTQHWMSTLFGRENSQSHITLKENTLPVYYTGRCSVLAFNNLP